MAGSLAPAIIDSVLAMTGTLRLGDSGAPGSLARRLHSYQTVRVSDSSRVVLIPPIGSFLVEWDGAGVRLHITGATQRDLDEVTEALDQELRRDAGQVHGIDWIPSTAVPVVYR